MKRLALLLVLLCASAQAQETLRIGSKRFTESYILAHVLAQTAAPALPSPPQVREGLGNTAIVYEALRSGAIDMYAEYSGTVSLEILKSGKPLSLEEMNRQLAPHGLAASIPLGFNDGYALALRADDAKRLGIRSVSDLAKHPELKLGLSNEFIGRADGWPGLAKAYALPHQPKGIDHGIAYDAIAAKQIDVMDIYTTDAKIGHLGLAVLDDVKRYFPRYDALVLHRADVPKRFPQAWARLQQLQGRIDEQAMIAMNANAELQAQKFDAIARDFLAGGGTAPQRQQSLLERTFGGDFMRLTWQHLGLVAASVAAAIAIGLPLGVLSFPHPRARAALLAAAGLLQTVPSIALLAILISLLGMIGVVPALVALALYALLPVMRNCVTGLGEVPQGLRDAATALGMSPSQGMRLVELPLALPTILAGVRIATSISIGTATIAAFVGAGGYGERIVTGLALSDRQLLLAGAIPAALLALASEIVFELVERRLRRRQSV
ncbi:glycine betaine ABC transporter substrate-binding protein [Ramlibacter sp. PS4R-6]|uniref:glycine betaine ABC transporter substrate-binding protein n=1 Tax=Ramlibacter sp. PS4R-6 TaxID=3133438 RepID=UPI0030B5EC38